MATFSYADRFVEASSVLVTKVLMRELLDGFDINTHKSAGKLLYIPYVNVRLTFSHILQL